MKKTSIGGASLAKLLTIGTVALTILGIILRVFSLFLYFEVDSAYYERSAILPTLTHIFFLLSILGFAAFAFMRAKDLKFGEPEENKDPTASVILAILGIGVMVYVIAKTYFDVFVPMNAPNKILLHMSALAFVFFMTSSARLSLGTVKKGLHLFFLCSAFFLTAVYSVPSVVVQTFTEIHRFPSYLYFDIVILLAFVFSAVKLFSLVKLQREESESLSECDEEKIPQNTSETTEETTDNTEE